MAQAWGLHSGFKLCQNPANPCSDGVMQGRLDAVLLKLAETVSGVGNLGNEMVWQRWRPRKYWAWAITLAGNSGWW